MAGFGLDEANARQEIAKQKWTWVNYTPITQEELQNGRKQVLFNKESYDAVIERLYGIDINAADNIQSSPQERRQQFEELTRDANGILPQRILTATASQIYNEQHPDNPVSLDNAAYNNPGWDLILDRLLRERNLLHGLRDDIKQALGGENTFDGLPRSYQQLLRIAKKLNQLSPEVLRSVKPLNHSTLYNPEELNIYEQSIVQLLSSPDSTKLEKSSQSNVVDATQIIPIQNGEMQTDDAEKNAAMLYQILLQLFGVNEQAIMQILNQSPENVQQIVKEYDSKYNKISGKGLFVDLKNKLDSTDWELKRYWEFVVAQFKRASINIPADILQNENIEKLEYLQPNDQSHDKYCQIVTDPPDNPIVTTKTQITYSVEILRAEIFPKTPNYQYQWYVLNDPETIKNHPSLPARYDHNDGNTWNNAEWQYPGNHKVICRVQVNDRAPVYVEYQQTVLPQQEVLDDAFNEAQIPLDPAQQAQQLKIYQQTLLNAEQQKDSNPLNPKVKEQLKAQSDALNEKLKSSEGLKRYPIKAVYLSNEGAKTFPLNIFVTQTEDRIGSPWAGRYTWTLVDITNPTDPRMSGEYKGRGATHQEAIQKAINDWNTANRYYPGIIKLKIPAEVTGEVIESQFETDGNNFWDSLHQFLDTIGFVTGIAAIVTGKIPVISVPLALISMATSSAAASIRLVQGRVEGRPYAVEDTLDILSIAGNVLSGVWLRGASLRNVRWGNVNISEGILIGQLVTDGGTGVILNSIYSKRYQEILKIKDPEERTKKLVKLLQEATLSNGMLLISITGTINDLESINRLANTSETIDVDNQTPSARPTPQVIGNVNIDFHTTKKLTVPELKAYMDAADNDWKKLLTRVLTEANNTPLMLQFTAYRKQVFNDLFQEVTKNNDVEVTVKAVVAGSEQPSSDYDATFISKTGDKGKEVEAVIEFNSRFRELFGKESGTGFDTNVYTSGHMLISSLGDTLEEVLALRNLEKYLDLPEKLIEAKNDLNNFTGNARFEAADKIKKMEELLPRRNELIKETVDEINKIRKANPNDPQAEIKYNNIDDIDIGAIKKQTKQTSDWLVTKVVNERNYNRVSERSQKQLAANQDVMALLKQRRYMSYEEWVEYSQSMVNNTDEHLKTATAARLDQANQIYDQATRELNHKIVDLNQNKPAEKQVRGNDQSPEIDSEKIRVGNQDAELEAYNRLYEHYLKEAQKIRYTLEEYRAIRAGEKSSNLSLDQVSTEIDKLTLQLDEMQSKALFFANEAYHTGSAAEHVVLGQQLKLEVPLEANQYLGSINEQIGFAMEQTKSGKSLGKALWKSSKYIDRVNGAIGLIKKKFPNPFNPATEAKISKMKNLFDKLITIKKEENQYYKISEQDKSNEAIRVLQQEGFNFQSVEELRSELLKFSVEINTKIRNAHPNEYNMNPSLGDNRSSYIPDRNYEQNSFHNSGNNMAQSPVTIIEMPEFG